MAVSVTGLREASTTVLTLERLLLEVGAQVVPRIAELAKDFLADGTCQDLALFFGLSARFERLLEMLHN